MSTKARGKRKSPHKKTPTFLFELPRGRRGRTGCTPAGAPGSRTAVLQRRALRGTAPPCRLEPTQTGRWPAPSPAHIPRSAGPPSRPCVSVTAFPSTHAPTGERAAGLVAGRAPGCRACADAGHRATAPSTGSVWAKPAAYASRVVAAGSEASRTSATTPGCASCSETPEEGHRGFLIWHDDQLPALIDWEDPVVAHGLAHPVKYARLVRRPASSLRAQGADREGDRYVVQLVLAGTPYHKPKHTVGRDTVGLDVGPASIAIVSREGEARLEPLCAELRPDARAIRRMQRQMDRQRRAANPSTTTSGSPEAAQYRCPRCSTR